MDPDSNSHLDLPHLRRNAHTVATIPTPMPRMPKITGAMEAAFNGLKMNAIPMRMAKKPRTPRHQQIETHNAHQGDQCLSRGEQQQNPQNQGGHAFDQDEPPG